MLQGLAQARRVAVVAALCAVAAIGLQARAALPTNGSGWAAEATGQAFYDIIGAVTGASTVASLVFFVILIRLRRKQRRKRSEATPLPWWGRMLGVLLVLAVIGGPVVLIFRALHHGRRALGQSTLPAFLRSHPNHALAINTSSNWAFVAGVGFAVAALIIAAVLARRQQAADDWPADRPAKPDRKPSLRAALSAGTAALREVADPRAAIIACYAAMEQSLAGAGAAPAAADTPDEVLARAASSGLIRSAAAGELTGLFRQARYGHRDMAETERAAAQGALTRLQADLGGAG
jgi:uncharacterized protein DUF4129